MPVEVILPKVDMDMTHGTLAVWHVAEGEVVAKGAALFDIETDKAAMEVEAPASGTLHHIGAAPGDKVAVGSIVAWIFAPGEPVGDRPPAESAAAEPTKAAAPVASVPASPPVPAPAQDALRATPAARAAARDAGVALTDVAGSGPLGRIQAADVTAYAGADAPVATGPAHWTPQPGPLHISRRKGTGTPIVLIHGFTADSQSWSPLEKAIGPDRPLIRIDLPGHGRSPRRHLGSFADLARTVVEAFDDATRDAGPVHLLGHSLGGALALAIADIRPRRVATLSLIAPSGLGPEIDAATLTGITRATRVESLAPWLRQLTATPEAISDDYVKAAMKLRTDSALRAVQTDMADVLFPDGVQSFDLRAALGRVTQPTCIIWGRQDHILPHRQALAVTGDFAIHLLAGAGHVPQIECPDRVARILVRQFAG
jgi:pimeloyl-ACP methyl ester carboxylesterase